MTRERYEIIRTEEVASLGGSDESRYREAAEILDGLILTDDFPPFLTIPAYGYLI